MRFETSRWSARPASIARGVLARRWSGPSGEALVEARERGRLPATGK